MATVPSTPLSAVDQEILRVLLYFGVFHHPLTPAEIAKFCSIPSVQERAVADRCRSVPLIGLVREESGFFSLRDDPQATLASRREKEGRAERLRPIARAMSRLISRFPYVRAVFISGELSKGVASANSDLDFLIITAEHRVWIARTLLILFKKIFLFNRRRYFCINHLQTEGHLQTAFRSYYAAVEVVTLVGDDRTAPYRKAYLDANPWIASVLPNTVPIDGGAAPIRPGPRFRRFLESLLPSAWADRADERLRQWWQRVWEKRYAHLSEDERRQRFSCSPYLSTAYGTDIANIVWSEWRRRLTEHGLDPSRDAEAA